LSALRRTKVVNPSNLRQPPRTPSAMNLEFPSMVSVTPLAASTDVGPSNFHHATGHAAADACTTMPSKNMPATRQTASGRTTFLSKQLMSGCIAGKHDHLISNFKFQIRDLKFEI
jgi:hypothetical protein